MSKQHNIALSGKNSTLLCTIGHVTAKFTTLFTWHHVAKLYNRIPFEIAPCKTVRDAKIYTSVLLVGFTLFFLPFIIPAVHLFLSARKEAGNE